MVRSSSTRTPIVALVAAIAVLAWPTDTTVGAGSTDQCVADRMADGETRVQAVAACIREATPTTVTAPEPGREADEPAPSDNEGASPLLILAAAVGGIAIGALAVATFGRRRPPRPAAPASAPTTTPPPPSPAAMAAASIAVARPADRAIPLVSGLADLSDRVPSQALRAEIIALLRGAGVEAVEVPPGTPFDATQMRGVAAMPPPDPTWNGRVASTDRLGFRDGHRVVRPPDVVVYRSE